MKKSQILLSLSFFAVFTGCGGLQIKPTAKQMKTIAIVSLYANRELYNIEAPREQEVSLGSFIKGLAKDIIKGMIDPTDPEEKQKVQLVSYSLQKYFEAINAAGVWNIAAADAALNDKHYKEATRTGAEGTIFQGVMDNLMKKEESKWVPVPGMKTIPIDSLLKRQPTTYINGKKVDEQAELKNGLAKLARDMGVDGVAIIQMDLGYRFGKLGVMKISFLGKSTTMVKPSISSAMVIVSKDGEVVVQTDPIERGGGSRFEGPSVGLIKDGVVKLDHARGKSVEAFSVAIESSAKDFTAQLSKKLSKV